MTDTYIVALSGYGTEEDRRKSLVAGFDTHLVKPLDPAALPGHPRGGRCGARSRARCARCRAR